MFCLGTALEQYCDVAAGLTGMILLALCTIDFSATQHYAEHGSGDGVWSEPLPSCLWCGWLAVSATAQLPAV